VTVPRAAVYPKGLAVRGKRLWRDVHAVRPRLGPGERVLLEEACRLADRLEAINDQLTGSVGALLTVETKDGKVFTLVVDAAQQEARLSTVALRQVLLSLGLDRMVVPEEPPVPAPAQQPAPAAQQKEEAAPTEDGDPADILAARRAAREAKRGEAGA
jgi:hypothetical protein